MRNIIIASHHQLAAGMKKTLDFLTGCANVYEISAYVDDTDINNQIDAVIDQIEPGDELFILTDIMGGSVTQKFFPYCSDRIHVISGMNLPLVIALALSPEKAFKSEDIHSMIEDARGAIIYVNEHISESDEDDE